MSTITSSATSSYSTTSTSPQAETSEAASIRRRLEDAACNALNFTYSQPFATIIIEAEQFQDLVDARRQINQIGLKQNMPSENALKEFTPEGRSKHLTVLAVQDEIIKGYGFGKMQSSECFNLDSLVVSEEYCSTEEHRSKEHIGTRLLIKTMELARKKFNAKILSLEFEPGGVSERPEYLAACKRRFNFFQRIHSNFGIPLKTTPNYWDAQPWINHEFNISGFPK